ncbi:MAG: dioxygenase [Spirochaetaceae bacterium]
MGSIIYLSHGGGPLPLLGDPSHKTMISFMKECKTAKKPDAVLVISAHWEEAVPTITGSAKPSLYYDYFGFPGETYNLNYPLSSSPELVKKIEILFNTHNMDLVIDKKRGFDHGVFVPMILIYPEADVPVVEISLIQGLDPKVHIELGKILTSLKDENILIIGSGASFHNMSGFNSDVETTVDIKNDEFQEWIIETCTTNLLSSEIENRLIHWEVAPGARYCHHREEHLLPLHVCYGIAEDKGIKVFDDFILGKRAVAIRWDF